MSLAEFKIEMEPKTSEVVAEAFMRDMNKQYREGNPKITDLEYDTLLAKYAEEFPNNSYFNQQEVEQEEIVGNKVKLPQKMLSTNKAYSHKEIEKFLDDCIEVGKTLGLEDVIFRVSPKLDGFAGFRQDSKLFTRGNGVEGTDISHAIANGLQSPQFDWVIDSNGPGEIVCNKEYFAEYLADSYENTRNIIAGAIKIGELDPKIKEAIRLGKIVFYPFNNLGVWIYDKAGVIDNLEICWDIVSASNLYNTDGLVIECVSEKIKAEIGCTSHHWKWMIAYKKNVEFHDVKVTGLEWNTARVGRITPVILLEPTEVLGVTVSRCSGHNAGLLMKQGINTGAIVKLTRSGAVIPHVVSVVEKSDIISIPTECPSCGSAAQLIGDHLMCLNKDCFAQVEGVVEHFFKEMGILGFGPVIVECLCKWGYDTVVDICDMYQQDFYNVIGGKTAENLYMAIQRRMVYGVEDWRFLGSFALDGIGGSMCEKLLQVYPLKDIFDLTVNDIKKINGFGDINSLNLVKSLQRIRTDFEYLAPMFVLIETPIGGVKSISPIGGKTIVFTGTMIRGSRGDMTKQAKALGATVGSSVTSSTNILVCGEKVGAAKINAAKKNDTVILTEEEYIELIK
jgi:DNA ligase (NAD+)